MAKNPLISVVIPTYNEEKLIGQCVQSLMQQTFSKENYEVLVIDNGSTDKTGKVARLAGARVVYYDEKKGASAARQYGTRHAIADIIAYTDADSIPESNWLETAYSIMQDKKYMCIGGTILPTGKSMLIKFCYFFYDKIALIHQFFHVPLIWGPNMIVRKKAFTKIGGFNLTLKTSDDWDFVMRVQKKFGILSTLYTTQLRVKTSPRRQENFSFVLPFIYAGVFNYFSVFLLHQSHTFGKQANIR